MLKKCPFCNSNKIDLSIKVGNHLSERWYRVAYYCKECNCYGPRVVYKTEKKARVLIERSLKEEKNPTRKEAEILWNSRV